MHKSSRSFRNLESFLESDSFLFSFKFAQNMTQNKCARTQSYTYNTQHHNPTLAVIQRPVQSQGELDATVQIITTKFRLCWYKSVRSINYKSLIQIIQLSSKICLQLSLFLSQTVSLSLVQNYISRNTFLRFCLSSVGNWGFSTLTKA